MPTNVAALEATLGLNNSQFMRGLAQSEKATSRLGRAFGSAVAPSRMLAAGLGLAAAAAGGLALKAVKLSSDLEQARIGFTTMLGSGEKAEKFLKDLANFAAKTPFELTDLRTASQRLLAMGFAAEEIIPTMKAIGDAVSGLGGGAFEIDRVVRALGQMRAKGKVSAEEMMQLAELGIPAWEILANKIGLSIPEAMKKAEQGAISADVAVAALTQGMSERFPNMMEKQSKTLAGIWSNIVDKATIALTTVGDEIDKTFDLHKQLQRLADQLDAMTKLLEEKGLKGALRALIPAKLAENIHLVAGAIIGSLVPAFVAAAVSAGRFIAALGPFAILGAVLAGLGMTIYQNWDKVAPVWNRLSEAAGGAWKALRKFLAPQLTKLAKTIGPDIDKAIAFLGKLKDEIGPIMASVSESFKANLPALKEAWQVFSDAIIDNWPAIKVVLQALGVVILAGLTTALVVINAVAGAIGGLAQVFAGIFSVVAGAISVFVGILTGNFEQVKQGFLSMTTGIGAILMGLINTVGGIFMGIYSAIMSVATALYNALVGHSIIPDIVNGIIGVFAGLPGALISLVSSAVSGIINLFAGAIGTLIGVASSIVAGIANAFYSLVDILASIGGQIISGLINGLVNGASRVYSVARAIAQEITRIIKSALDITSPSKVMMEVGKNISLGLAKGMEIGLPPVQLAAAAMPAAVMPPVLSAAPSRPLASGPSEIRLVLSVEGKELVKVISATVDGKLASVGKASRRIGRGS